MSSAKLINILLFSNLFYIYAMEADKEDPNLKLINAAKNDDLKQVLQLIESGADINYAGGFALLKAAKRGHHNIVKLLIENKAEVNCFRNLPLVQSIERDHFEVVKILLFYGAEPNYPASLTIKKQKKIKIMIFLVY